MSRKYKKSNRNLYSLMATSALVIIALIAGVLIYNAFHSKPVHVTDSSKYSSTPAPAADNNANNSRKTSSSPSTTLNNSSTAGSSTGNSNLFTVGVNATVINNAAAIHVGTEVVGVTSGNCTLTASQSGEPIQQLGTSSVKLDVNYYDCGVFNIATSSLPASGTWNLTLTVTSGSSSASGSGTVTF